MDPIRAVIAGLALFHFALLVFDESKFEQTFVSTSGPNCLYDGKVSVRFDYPHMELVSKAEHANQEVHTVVKFKPKDFHNQAFITTSTGVESLLNGAAETKRWDKQCDAYYTFNGATFNMIISVLLAIVICVHDESTIKKSGLIVCICFAIIAISMIMRIAFTQSILQSGNCHANYFKTHKCLTTHAKKDIDQVDMALLGTSLTVSLAALVYQSVLVHRAPQ
jgi:hypothetical protein